MRRGNDFCKTNYFEIYHKYYLDQNNRDRHLTVKSIFLHYTKKKLYVLIYYYKNVKVMKTLNCKIEKLHHKNVK